MRLLDRKRQGFALRLRERAYGARMVRAYPGKPQQPLLEKIARAVCEEYLGDPDAVFAHRPMWNHFLDDAHALLPIVVALANDVAQPDGRAFDPSDKKPPANSMTALR